MNVTDGNNSEVSCENEIRVAGFITFIEGVITFILNGTVIVLLIGRRKKTNIVLLILHLAVVDFAVAVLHDFTRTIQLLTDWTYGEHTCRGFLFSQQVALFASTYILISLCYDRLFALWKPLWPGRTNRKNRYGMVLFPWILAAVFSLPYLNSGIKTHKGKVWCTPFFRGQYGDIYLPIQMTLMTFIPAIILASVYGFIAYIVRIHTKVNHNQFLSILKAERRSIITALVVGLTFIVCWVPYSFSIVYNRFVGISGCALFYIPNAFAPLNSAVNPVLILTFNFKIFKQNNFQRGSARRYGALLSLRKSNSKSDEKK